MFTARRFAVTLLAAWCSLAVATPVTAQRKVDLDRETKVKEWGYKFRPIKGWITMPPDQGDRVTVGRWKLSLDEFEKRGDYEALNSGRFCELRILRFGQAVAETPGKAADEKKPESSLPASLLAKLNPKTFEDWISANYENADKRWTREPLKRWKMKGDVIEFGHTASAITIGTFNYLGVEWAVVYTSFEENYKKTWQDIYLKSILSFEIYDNVDPDVANAARVDPMNLEGEARRGAFHASIAGADGWYAVDTAHYVFLSNCSDKRFIKQLSDQLEMVREKVYMTTFAPRNDKTPLNPVRVFDKQSEYHQYGGPGGSAGYFSPSKGELVLFAKFQDASKSSSMNDCRSVMYHEGFHQYIHFAIGDVSPHSWFNEGHGDFYAGITISGPKISFKEFDWRVRYLKDHMSRDLDLIPCRTLVRMPQSEYYSNGGLKYSQGWALIYYLRNVSKKQEHQDALNTYFSYLADNVMAFKESKKKDGGDERRGEPIPGIPGLRVVNFEDAEKVEKILSQAVDKAFASVDFEALDRDLRDWIQKL